MKPDQDSIPPKNPQDYINNINSSFDDPTDWVDEDEPIWHPDFGFKRKEENPAARYY